MKMKMNGGRFGPFLAPFLQPSPSTDGCFLEQSNYWKQVLHVSLTQTWEHKYLAYFWSPTWCCPSNGKILKNLEKLHDSKLLWVYIMVFLHCLTWKSPDYKEKKQTAWKVSNQRHIETRPSWNYMYYKTKRSDYCFHMYSHLSTELRSPFCIAASNLSWTILFSFASASWSKANAPAISEPVRKPELFY